MTYKVNLYKNEYQYQHGYPSFSRGGFRTMQEAKNYGHMWTHNGAYQFYDIEVE